MADQDPLQLFRAALAASQPPTLLSAASDPASSLAQATYISFPQAGESSGNEPIHLSKDTATRYTAKPDSRDEFYTLGQIWLCWNERETGVREYLMKGQQEGARYVSIADRRGVVEYLNGESEGGGRVLPKGHKESESEAAAPARSALVESIPNALESSAEAGPSKAAPSKRVYEVDVADRDFCKKLRAEEIELRDRNTVLRQSGSGKVHNFQSFAQGVMAEKIRNLRQSMAPAGAAGGKASQASQQQSHDPSRGAKKAKSTNPIIMISSSPTALITMWNVKKFLEQGIFEPSDVARQNEAAAGNTRAEDVIMILRKRPGPNGEVVNLKYYVVDSADALLKFGSDAWDRVICVLTTGQAWQFKPYKWQDPKQLFRHIKGVYFQWHNEQTNPVVRDWNVTEMRIDKAKRHTDRQVVADFWRILDSVKRR